MKPFWQTAAGTVGAPLAGKHLANNASEGSSAP